jgi:hypothetical protein
VEIEGNAKGSRNGRYSLYRMEEKIHNLDMQGSGKTERQKKI